MVALNAEAPEFHPIQLRKVQQYHFFYYPTVTTTPLPLTSVSFHDVTIPNQPSLAPPEPEPTHYHHNNMADNEPSHELVQQEEKEARAGGSKSKGVVQKQVFKAIISAGKIEGQRRSDGLRLQAYAWRRKGSSEEVVAGDQKCVHLINNKQRRQIISSEQYFRAFPEKKKRACPVVPVRADGDETTVMIRNIPSKYTRDMLVQFLENHCMLENERIKGDNENVEENILAFDFVYLPIDFRSGLNKGYAFVNFTKPQGAWKFLLTASYRKWDLFLSHKIREVVAARLQGREKLERQFETMNFPCESEEVLPVCFSPPRDGVTKGNQRTMGKLLKRRQQL